MVSQKKLNRKLNKALHRYTSGEVWKRINMYNRISRMNDIFDMSNTIEMILVGSLREGIGIPMLNDTDILKVDHTVLCQTGETYEGNETKTVFQMLKSNTPAGYCYLKLISPVVPNLSYVEWQMFGSFGYTHTKYSSSKYVSSFMFKLALGFSSKPDDTTNEFRFFNIHGPSLPVMNYFLPKTLLSKLPIILKIWINPTDVVVAFPCEAEDTLEKWGRRNRKSGWPKQKVISQVMNLPVYVVPVGQKGSVNENFQWRVSFTMAEMRLVQSFNSTHRKVYIIVKYLAKYYLEAECANITSYVIKNVIFWIAEDIPAKKFRPKHLIARVKDALHFLKRAVQRKKLKNYMEPKKNLFASKFEKYERRKCLQMLTSILEHADDLLEVYILTSNNMFVKTLKSFLFSLPNILEKFIVGMGLPRLQVKLFAGSLLSSHYRPNNQNHLSSNNTDQIQESAIIEKPSEYAKGPINMLAPYPYLLLFFLCLPMKFCLSKFLPSSQPFLVRYEQTLRIVLFISYVVSFYFVQRLKISGKAVFVDYLSYKIITYVPKYVQRIEEFFLCFFVPAFSAVFAFTEIKFGLNLPFLMLGFVLLLLSHQIQKAICTIELTSPGFYRLYQVMLFMIFGLQV